MRKYYDDFNEDYEEGYEQGRLDAMNEMKETHDLNEFLSDSKDARVKSAFNYLKSKAKDLVPSMGYAESVAGEIIRAISRVIGRWGNDGDLISNRYVSPAGSYLWRATKDVTIKSLVKELRGIKKSDYNSTDDEYFLKLGELAIAVANFIKNHPELEEKKNSGYQF